MKKFFAALAVSLFIVVMPAVAHADVNDFVIERFVAQYNLSRDDPQGRLQVKEIISVNFNDQNHGILRAIPDRYKNHRLQMDIKDIRVDGQDTRLSTYGSNGNTVLKIGDPDKTITGHHVYEIEYIVRNVITFYDGHDEFYWDINGDQWQQEAEEVSVVLTLPEGLQLSTQKPLCYTGGFGSLNRACQLDVTGGIISAQTTQPLAGYENMSIVVGFEKNYFHPPTWQETAAEYAGMAAKFLVPFLLIGGTAGIHWYRYGRDPKGRGVMVPEYEAPQGLKPMEAGTVADFRTDNRDITATIIDLAIRGYIKIIETVRDRKILKDLKTYSLRLQNDNFEGLDSSETVLLKHLFEKQLQSNHPVGGEVELASLKYKLASVSTQLRQDLRASLVQRGYFRKTPLSTTFRFAGLLLLEFFIVAIMAAIFGGAAVWLGIGAGTALAVVFILLLPSRTPKGVATRESILGLKLYLEVAESERIKKMQSPDAPYRPASHEPKKTVELFEKLLPYAMVLSVEEKWAEQFEQIYRRPPDWYQGNWGTFNAVYLVHSLNSGVVSNVNAAFSSPSSSSSSGFSGGGSGGGGGGGGGGGW